MSDLEGTLMDVARDGNETLYGTVGQAKTTGEVARQYEEYIGKSGMIKGRECKDYINIAEIDERIESFGDLLCRKPDMLGADCAMNKDLGWRILEYYMLDKESAINPENTQNALKLDTDAYMRKLYAQLIVSRGVKMFLRHTNQDRTFHNESKEHKDLLEDFAQAVEETHERRIAEYSKIERASPSPVRTGYPVQPQPEAQRVPQRWATRVATMER